jgi:hypothetical protein
MGKRTEIRKLDRGNRIERRGKKEQERGKGMAGITG